MSVRRALSVESVHPDVEAGVRMIVIAAVPLALALIADRLDIGLLATLGAFNVGLADPGGSHRARASATLDASVVMTIAMALSTLVAGTPWLAVLVVACWTLALALVGSLGGGLPGVAFVGSVVFIVGLGLPDDPQEVGFRVASFAIGCGWAVLVIVSMWPLRPDRTARRELAGAVRSMADFVRHAPHGDRERSAGRDEIAGALRSARRAVPHRSAVSSGSELVALFDAADVIWRSLGAVDSALGTSSGVPDELAAAVEALASTCDSLADAIETGGRWDTDRLRSANARLDEVELDTDGAVVRAALQLVDRRLSEQRAIAPVTDAWRLSGFTQRVRGLVDHASITFRHAIRLSVVVAVAQAAAFVDPFAKGYWIPLTVVVVLKPDLGSTLDRSIQRTVGTSVGALVAFASISVADGREWVLAVLFTVCVFAMASLLESNYALGIVGLTPAVILLLAIDGGGTGLVVERIGGTLVGAALALLGAFVLWPLWARRSLAGEVQRASAAAGRYLAVVTDAADAAVVQAAHQDAELARSNVEAMQRRMLAEPRRDRVAPIDVAEFCEALGALIDATTQLRAMWLAQRPDSGSLAGAVRAAQWRLDTMAGDDAPVAAGGGLVHDLAARAPVVVDDSARVLVGRIDRQTRSMARTAQRIDAALSAG